MHGIHRSAEWSWRWFAAFNLQAYIALIVFEIIIQMCAVEDGLTAWATPRASYFKFQIRNF